MQRVVLRAEKTDTDIRSLSAELDGDGDLVFIGQDLGRGVEAAFGCSEYEWTWMIRAADLPRLAEALGCAGADLLEHLARTFSHERAAGLWDFLQAHGIPYESWSRIGD